MILEIQFQIGHVPKYDTPSGDRLEADLFAECQRRWPQFFESEKKPIWAGIAMWVQGNEEDPEIREVMQFLKEHGREPWSKRYPSAVTVGMLKTHFQVSGMRTFEKKDIEEAEYFSFFCPRAITSHGARYHDQEGHLALDRSNLTRQQIGQTNKETACTDEFRKRMEAEHFIGMAFRPIFPVGRQTLPQPYWQLWADRTMPPLLNRLVNRTDGEEFDPRKRGGCAVDDFYFPPLFRFSAKAVRAMEPFDFALTLEPFGTGDLIGRDPKTGIARFPDPIMIPEVIVSRRFREWCLKQKLKIDWWPVALE